MTEQRSSLVKHLRQRLPSADVKAGAEPGVAIFRISLRMGSNNTSKEERDALVREWITTYAVAFLMGPSSSEWQRVTDDDIFSRPRDLEEGGWMLLFQKRADALQPHLRELRHLRDADIARFRRLNHSDLLILSWEDDVEWTISVDEGWQGAAPSDEAPLSGATS